MDLRKTISLLEAKDAPGKLETEALPYGRNDLAPVMSADTIEYHYEKLAKGYARRYNDGEGDADFNRAGSYLHNLFFPQLKEPRGANRPHGAIADLIDRRFGSYDDFREKFAEQAMKIQGSGWIYLSRQGEIKTIRNHEIKRDIALLIDWWEHAWALDYQSDKAKYLKNMWRIINWDVVNQRL